MAHFLKIVFICVLSLFSVAVARATTQGLREGTKSAYKDGVFFTEVVYEMDASANVASAVVDEIYEGMQTAPTSKLGWAWKNLGRHQNVENDIMMWEKGVSLNPSTSAYSLCLAIQMAGQDEPMLFDVEGTLKRRNGKGRNRRVELDVTKKIKILNSASFVVESFPYEKGRSLIVVKTRIRFGWFFRMFFSEQRYRQIMEWRIQGFALNIKNHTESKAKAS